MTRDTLENPGAATAPSSPVPGSMPSPDVHTVTLCGDGRHAASGGADRLCFLWDVEVGKPLGAMAGHADYIINTCFAERRILTASGDGTVKVWDARSLACTGTLAGHTSVVRCLEAGIGADHTVVTGSDDGTVKIWDLRAEKHGSRLTLTGALRRHIGTWRVHADVSCTLHHALLRPYRLGAGDCMGLDEGRVWRWRGGSHRAGVGHAHGRLRPGVQRPQRWRDWHTGVPYARGIDVDGR